MREPIHQGDEITYDYELQVHGVFIVVKIDSQTALLRHKISGEERHDYVSCLYLYRSAAQIRSEKIDTLLN